MAKYRQVLCLATFALLGKYSASHAPQSRGSGIVAAESVWGVSVKQERCFSQSSQDHDDHKLQVRDAHNPASGVGFVGAKPKCPRCDVVFTIKHNLNRHIRAHHPDVTLPPRTRPYICTFCNQRYKYEDRLNVHIATHDPDAPPPKVIKPHACAFASCSRCYKHRSELKRHTKTHHPPRTGAASQRAKHYDEVWKCQICTMQYSDLDSFVRHIRKKHPTRAAWASGGTVDLSRQQYSRTP